MLYSTPGLKLIRGFVFVIPFWLYPDKVGGIV
jgi:hypothetical protein